MGKRSLVILMCIVLMFSMAACRDKEKEKEEQEKARQEEIQRENEAAANAVVSAIEALPEKLKLKDETSVAGARAMYDELTDEQKALVPSEMVTKLEEAEKTIEEHRKIKEERDAEKKADKEAAKQAESVISGIPSPVTLDAENAVLRARSEYNQLSDNQKKYVKKSSLEKLTSAEARIQELKKEEEKKAEAKKKAEEKKKNEKKKEKEKKKAPKQDKYAVAKKYIGKKASALIAAIGKPNKKKKNPNCATDGEEYIYYYDGFYVGVLSQDMNSPLIVQNVTKN